MEVTLTSIVWIYYLFENYFWIKQAWIYKIFEEELFLTSVVWIYNLFENYFRVKQAQIYKLFEEEKLFVNPFMPVAAKTALQFY